MPKTIAFVLAAALSLGATAQDPVSTEQLARAVHETELMLGKLSAMLEHAEAAAKGAQQSGEAAEAEDLKAAAAKLAEAVGQLQSAAVAAQLAVEAAHAEASKLAPSPVAAALAAQEVAFDAAVRARDPEDAEKGFAAVAAALDEPLFADHEGARRLRAMARFQENEALKSRAVLWLDQSRKRVQGEQLLRDACEGYEALVDGPDFSGPWGTSLHAAALRKVIGIEGAFFERYVRYRQDPKVWRRVKSKAQACSDHAQEVYEWLGRSFADARTGNGQEFVVEAARADIQRMFQLR